MELDRSYIESKLVFYPAFEITWHQEWALLAITVCWLVGKLLFLIALSLYPFPFRVDIDSSPNKIVPNGTWIQRSAQLYPIFFNTRNTCSK